MVSFGWARLRTRKNSEKFSRSFSRRTPENTSPSTRARKQSTQSRQKSSTSTGRWIGNRAMLGTAWPFSSHAVPTRAGDRSNLTHPVCQRWDLSRHCREAAYLLTIRPQACQNVEGTALRTQTVRTGDPRSLWCQLARTLTEDFPRGCPQGNRWEIADRMRFCATPMTDLARNKRAHSPTKSRWLRASGG